MTESASLLSGESTGCSSDVSSPEPPPLPLCPPPELIDLVSSSSSSTGDDSSLSEESLTPPKAPPRIHRSPHKSCRGQEVESAVKQTEATTSLTSTVSEVSSFKSTLTPIKNDTHQRSSNSNNNNNNNNNICHQEIKSGSHRQRHPALLLQPLKTERFSNLTKISHVKQLSCPVTPVQINSFKPMIPSQHPSQQRLMPPSSFWTSDHLPSGSEFDTTRLNAYINNFNNARNSFISQPRPTSRNLKRHSRSKSVDRIHGVKGQLPTLVISQDMKYLVNMNNHRKVHHHFPGSLVQEQKNNLSKLVSSFKATAINAANRALIIPRTQDSLNSSDPDSGSTSGDNDNEVSPSSSSGVKLPHLVNRSMEPAKSALKKTVSSSSNSTIASPPVKNVTFSAFATVQMVDE